MIQNMLSSELLSLFAGSLSGFIFKMMAQNAADRQQITELLIKRQQAADNSSDLAAKRAPGKAGEWTRRLIIVSVLFGVVLAPFLLALLDKPVIVEVQTAVKSFLGIFKWGGNTQFFELNSYVLIPELRSALLALIGFYFGNSVAKRSNV